MIQPFLFMHQYDTHLKVYINDFEKGFNQICWYERENPENLNVKEATSNPFILEGIHKGDYVFYSKGPDNEASGGMRLFFQENFAPERVKQYKTYMKDFPQTPVKQKFIEDLEFTILHEQDKPTLFILADQFEKIKKEKKELLDQDRSPYIKLCPIIERYENRLLSSMNKNSFGSATLTYEPMPVLTCHEMVTEVHIYKISDGKKMFFKKIHMDEDNSVRICFDECQAYVIYLFQDSDMVGELHHYQMDNDSMNIIWGKLVESEQAYKDIVEDDEEIGAVDVATLSPEERKMYAEEYHVTSADTVFPRLMFGGPEGILEDGQEINGTLDVYMPRFPMIDMFKQPLYIVNRDADFLMENDFDALREIKHQHEDVNPRENSSTDDQLFFIATKDGQILNRAERYKRNISLYDYKRKRNRLELIAYFKRLRALFQELQPEVMTTFNDIVSTAEEDETLNIDNISDYMIGKIVRYDMLFGTDDSIYLVLQNKFSHLNYNQEFFESRSCILHAGERRFSFQPQKEEYVLVVGFVPQKTDSIQYSYYHSGLGAIDVLMNDYGMYFVYAVSEKDFRVSGFLLFNSLTSHYKTWNLEVSVDRA